MAGCVIGYKNADGDVELFNSFELVIDASGVIDIEYFLRKEAHYKNVFREWDVLGWYTAPVTATHQMNHDAMAKQIGSADIVSLVLDPTTKDSEALPFTATCQGAATTVRVVSTDAEKIGIDHIARVVPQGGSASMQLTAHLGGVHGAIGKLSEGIEVIRSFLKGIKSGAIKKDHALLRQVQSLTNRLQVCKTEQSAEALLQDYNDVLLVTLLSTLTKSNNETEAVVEKIGQVVDRSSHRSHRPF